MKTRIIKTKFWNSGDVMRLSKDARYLFIHLLTCDRINMCGIFEYSDDELTYKLSLDRKGLEAAKAALQEARKVLFFQDWIMVVNAPKHNNYTNNDKCTKTFLAEQEEIPDDVKIHFTKTLEAPTTSDTVKVEQSPIPTVKSPAKAPAKANSIGVLYLIDLPEDDLKEFVEKFPLLTKDEIVSQAERAHDWCKSKSRWYTDYKAFLRNWLRRVSDERQEKGYTPEPEHRFDNDDPSVSKFLKRTA